MDQENFIYFFKYIIIIIIIKNLFMYITIKSINNNDITFEI